MTNKKEKEVKGIILAGGFGTRLRPMTKVTNKHLLPVYDKPMIYYPINTLVNAGIKDIMIITGSESAGDFIDLLGNGEDFGAHFVYKTQSGAGGIAEALALCRDYVDDNPMVVILGDNIFTDDISEHVAKYKDNHNDAMVFLKRVDHPERFGVATLDKKNINYIDKIVEKPSKPETDLAVTGLYFYNASVWHVIDLQEKSDRGELEITDVNNWYIKNGQMKYRLLKDFWSDAGTIESLYNAATEIRKNVLGK